MRYTNYLVTFTEIPDEICLCFNLCGCCNRKNPCTDCFEPWLQDPNYEQSEIFTIEKLAEALKSTHFNCSCICFLGGDWNMLELAKILKQTRNYLDNLSVKAQSIKLAVYSGAMKRSYLLEPFLDYYKTGRYIPQLGGLNSAQTNQRLYQKNPADHEWVDITYKFRKKA